MPPCGRFLDPQLHVWCGVSVYLCVNGAGSMGNCISFLRAPALKPRSPGSCHRRLLYSKEESRPASPSPIPLFRPRRAALPSLLSPSLRAGRDGRAAAAGIARQAQEVIRVRFCPVAGPCCWVLLRTHDYHLVPTYLLNSTPFDPTSRRCGIAYHIIRLVDEA